MRQPHLVLALLVLPCALSAQGRFIEVQVSDTVRLPFAGMDLAVRMQNPFDLASQLMTGDNPDDKAFAKALTAAETKAKTGEQEFLDLMKTNNFSHRLKETEHAEDYVYNTGKTFDVNTYLVELKNSAEMEKFYQLTQGRTEFNSTPEGAHYGDPSSETPRLMRKLYDQAHKKAEALISVTTGHLGRLISAQELPQTEGSFFEQLMKMDKGGNKDDELMMLGSTHTSTIAFRFELLD